MTKPRSKIDKKPSASPASVVPAVPVKSGLPTVEQIALIAATLAREADARNFLPSVLTKRAMTLWLSATETIFWADIYEEVGQLQQKQRAVKNELNRFFNSSEKFPISRDEFLKRALPEKANRPSDLAKLFKRFLKQRLFENDFFTHKKWEEPSEVEINTAYDNFGPLQDHHMANLMALRFSTWHQERIAESRSAAGRISGAKRKKSNEIGPPELTK